MYSTVIQWRCSFCKFKDSSSLLFMRKNFFRRPLKLLIKHFGWASRTGGASKQRGGRTERQWQWQSLIDAYVQLMAAAVTAQSQSVTQHLQSGAQVAKRASASLPRVRLTAGEKRWNSRWKALKAAAVKMQQVDFILIFFTCFIFQPSSGLWWLPKWKSGDS